MLILLCAGAGLVAALPAHVCVHCHRAVEDHLRAAEGVLVCPTAVYRHDRG